MPLVMSSVVKMSSSLIHGLLVSALPASRGTETCKQQRVDHDLLSSCRVSRVDSSQSFEAEDLSIARACQGVLSHRAAENSVAEQHGPQPIRTHDWRRPAVSLHGKINVKKAVRQSQARLQRDVNIHSIPPLEDAHDMKA